MATTHRELDGSWAECPAPDACELPFHFPDMTVAEAQSMPLTALLPLLEILQPPSHDDHTVVKAWMVPVIDGAGEPDLGFHRDYDLPALIEQNLDSSEPYGKMSWYQHDELHRDGDRPAVVGADGTLKWFQHGHLHRDLPQAAVVWRDYAEYWVNGIEQRWNGKSFEPRYKDRTWQA